MDYLVGVSPQESQGSSEAMNGQANAAGGTSMSATAAAPAVPFAPAPAAQAAPAQAPVDTSIVDMLDFSAFDPLQLDQLTASAGLTQAAVQPGQQPLDLQQQQQYYMQHPGYVAAVQALAQPATTALQTMGQQPQQPDASVVSSSDASTQQQAQYAMPMHPGAVLSAAQTVPSAFPASVVSASTAGGEKDDEDFTKKRPRNWDKMSNEEKRRWERNMREQQRSHKISSQIKELRTLLTESNVPFKPNKYSILLSVAEYIKQLQSRAIMLDAEHRKLIDTIRVTSEMVNSGQTPEPDVLSSPAAIAKEEQGSNLSSDADMLFVQGLDYQSVFDQCITPMGIAALDGRILACNEAFQSILGYSREELLKHSLFTVMQNHEEVYKAMGEMLKADDITLDSDLAVGKEEKPPLYWSGVVGQTQENKLTANISLTRSANGSPKFFNCALMIS